MRTRSIGGAAVLAVVFGAIAGQPAPQGGSRKFAVVIGLSRYEDPGAGGLKYAHWDARLFAQHLKTVRGGEVPDRNIKLLVDQDATGTQIEKAFRWLGTNVGRRDQVYIFISGVGRSTVLSKDGYLLPFDRPAEKDPLSLTTLKTWLQNCCSFAEVYLFADICREQPVFQDIPLLRRIPLDNKINFSFRNLAGAGIGSPFGGLLASREKATSLEAPQRDLPGDEAQNRAESGFGLFSYFLVHALQAPSKVLPVPPSDPGQFVEFLGNHMAGVAKRLDNREQKPMPIGKLAAIPVDWKKPGTSVRTGAMAPRFPALASLLAFNGPPFLAVAAQVLPAPGALERFRTAVADGNLHGAGSVEELLTTVRAQLGGFSDQQRDSFVIAAEDAGQQIVARYGTGDQFPDDPRRVTKADFDLAAELFTEARDARIRQIESSNPSPQRRRLCPDDPDERRNVIDDPDLLSLEARRLFAQARAGLSEARGAPSRAEIQQAARKLRCAAEIEPSMPEIRNALGISDLLLAQFESRPERALESAAAHFRQALELSPNWAYPRHNLALVYTEQGRFSAAEKEIRAAIERTPYYPYLHYNLGLALQRANKLEDAERAYREAIGVFDVQIQRYRARGSTWTDLPSRARLARSVAATLTRNEAEAYNALGSLYFSKRSLALAEKNYALALKNDPAHAPARHNLALLHLARSERDQAEALLRTNVEFHLSRLKLAQVLAARGEPAEARRHFESVLSRAPGNTEARMGLAAALTSLREFQRAADVLTAPNGRSSAALQEQLGDVYVAAGEKVKACAAFADALRLAREQFAGSSGRNRPDRALKKKLDGCPIQK